MTHVLRGLVRVPFFTGLVIVTLALGIAANTAIFSVIQAVLLKPLPFHDPEQLVSIDHRAPGVNIEHPGSAAFCTSCTGKTRRASRTSGCGEATPSA